jgi:hypothetical protein
MEGSPAILIMGVTVLPALSVIFSQKGHKIASVALLSICMCIASMAVFGFFN